MKNPIKILALAGLILAVVASSTGFAATYSYDSSNGGFKTHWDGSAPHTDHSISGDSKGVQASDTLRWYNTAYNYAISPITDYIGASATAQSYPQGLNYNENSISVPGWSGGQPGSNDQWHTATVAYAGTKYTVNAYQSYYNGWTYITTSNDGTSYN